jgi:hypothetical protein
MPRTVVKLPLTRSVLDASGFWSPWEERISTLANFEAILGDLLTRWPGRQFAWRGMSDSSWPLHSSLYRRLWWSELRRAKQAGEATVVPPGEDAVYDAETRILADMHRWGLHNASRGRLSILSQLATAQHFGIPTRLIDVTLNAFIGLWFAVSERDGRDGRIWAIDITGRLINEQAATQRDWEDALHRPWGPRHPADWTKATWAWKPAPFEARIAAQTGAFIFGGAPVSEPGSQITKRPTGASSWWKTAELRSYTSISQSLHKFDAGRGRTPAQPSYTFLVEAGSKASIREALERRSGYSFKTVYPDYPGFAKFGCPDLADEPPTLP